MWVSMCVTVHVCYLSTSSRRNGLTDLNETWKSVFSDIVIKNLFKY